MMRHAGDIQAQEPNFRKFVVHSEVRLRPLPLDMPLVHVNDELIEKIIGQQILYYPIDIDRTNFHDVYGESIQKTFLSPIRVYVLVDWDESASTFGYVEGLHVDFSSQIVVHFHKRRLSEDQNLYTRVGDFLYYGDQYYEITTLKEPKPLFGQVDQSFEITAVCTRARGSYFDAS